MTGGTAFAVADPAQVRAERRRLVHSVAAHRRLLAGRPSFERSDLRRRNREARERKWAQQKYDTAVRRADDKCRRAEQTCARRLSALDGSQGGREREALAALRRQFVERRLNDTRLSPQEVNGLGEGLVRDLAASGIRTAADFTRISYAKAPNGRGGTVVWIHRTRGGKVHINGIGEHRARTLVEWRSAALARAESRAPQKLPPDELMRIHQIIADERAHLQREKDEALRAAEASRVGAGQLHAETTARLGAAEQEAWTAAALRRADFDEMAERLLALQAELRLHMDRHDTTPPGFRLRRAQARVLRPVPPVQRLPESPFVPPPRAPASGGTGGRGARPAAAGPADFVPGRAPSLLWLVPIVFSGMTALWGAGDADAAAPLWLRACVRLGSLAMSGYLACLWVSRRRSHRAGPMPAGSRRLTASWLMAVISSDVFLEPDGTGAGVAAAVIAFALALGSVVARGRR